MYRMTDASLLAGAVQHPLNPRGQGFLGLGRRSLVTGLPLLADADCQIEPFPILDWGPTPWALIHAPIVYQQIILDKPPAKVFNVGTLKEGFMTKIIQDGRHYAQDDDGAIHKGKPDEKDYIASTTFCGAKDNDDRHWSLHIHGTLPEVGPDTNWLQMHLTEYTRHRSKNTYAILTVDKVRRLRDLCNLVLGEA